MAKGKYIRTDEIKRKNSLGNKGKHISEALKLKRSIEYTGVGNPFYGKRHTEETKKHFSRMFRGRGQKTKPGYSALHTWVRRRLEKPKVCQSCNVREPFDLANITGIYERELSNWNWLCRSCHSTLDKKVLNIKRMKLMWLDK